MAGFRYRVHFGKGPPLRFIGHLDLHRAWERTLRRARLPIAFSEGFNPRPRINIGQALPLGCTSQEDLLDMWLAEQLDPLELRNRIAESAPAGLAIEEVQALRDDEPTLQRIIDGAEYEIQVDPSDLKGVTDRIAQVLAAHRIPRVRRGKAYDLRPLIEHLALEIEGRLLMRLSARQGATGRPDEVLKALELTPEDYVPHRTRLLLSK